MIISWCMRKATAYGVVVVEGVSPGKPLSGWVMEDDKDHHGDREERYPPSATSSRSRTIGRATASSNTASTLASVEADRKGEHFACP